MVEECAPTVPFARLLGRSGFRYSFSGVEDSSGNNIQEIISLGIYLMWINDTVCGGNRGVKIWVRVSYEMWKSLYSESSVMFELLLIFWEYSGALVMMGVQSNHLVTVLWISYLTVSNYSLCIHTRALELSVRDRMCVLGPSCWMVS